MREAPPHSAFPYLGWGVAGLALIVLAVVLLWPDQDSAPSAANAPFATAPGASQAAGGTGVDIASMTPRERADRLFDRVMRELSAGDTAQALAFVPMALDAHALVDEMDADLHYHVAMLRLLAGEPERTRAHADTILSAEATHLFGLHAAGRAHQVMGEEREAAEFYRRLLDGYEEEFALGRPEYQAHAPALPYMRRDAEEYLASRE